MATKRFCDECGAEIDFAAESKASRELTPAAPKFSQYPVRVSVEISGGNDDICRACIWKLAALAIEGGRGVKDSYGD